MKPKLIIKLAVIFGVSAIVVYVVAQTFVVQRQADKLTAALAVLGQGDVQQAKELLTAIGPGEPAYPAAQRYLAICVHEAGDWRGFLKLTEQMDLSAPVVPREIREELAYRQIDALFKARKFEELLPRISAFQQTYPGSTKLPGVIEYQLAALFERGMKKAFEAAKLTDPNKSAARRAEAEANLQSFVGLVSQLGVGEYKVLPKRDLQREVWSAQIALGREQALLAGIPVHQTALREALSLVRIELLENLRPKQFDEVLQLMQQFLNDFPQSTNRMRVEYKMLRLSFRAGEALAKEASALERAGDFESAGAKRAAARRYFEIIRSGKDRIIPDPRGGISESDLSDLRREYLGSYYWTGEYTELERHANEQLQWAGFGGGDWLSGKVWLGIALAVQGGARLAEAAVVLDEVLGRGFSGNSCDAEEDSAVMSAAKWRVYVALQQREVPKANQIAAWVQSANCARHLKADFEKVYKSLIGEPAN